MTSEDTSKPISSPASAGGPSPSDLPAGPMTDLFGQALVPASLSAQPVRVRQPMTTVTCGLRGYLSSPSAALDSFLVNRLMTQLDGAGSILFSLTWKRKATPAGRPYYQLAASARRTSETGFGSWPTPDFHSGSGGRVSSDPLARTRPSGTKKALTINEAAQMAAWPTPCAQQANGEPEAFLERKRRSVARGSSMGISLTDLQMVAKLATWPTPRAEDAENSGMRHSRGVADTLTAVSGLATGFPAQTEKPGQLDPDHSRWLMGYSADHLNCAPTEMPSSRKSRQSSSPQASKQSATN